MRKTNGLVITLVVAGILGVVTVAPYFYVFSGPFSQSSQDWANFGDYVGGTLGPFYAFLAFTAATIAIIDGRRQAALQGFLMMIQRYETEFDFACSRAVTCNAPEVWGNSPKDPVGLKSVALRTLLYSHSIDWRCYLAGVITGNDFRVLPTGEISQDREIVFSAQCAIDGIFRYLALYKSAGGDAALIDDIRSRYEMPNERLEIATRDMAEFYDELRAEEIRKGEEG